MNRRRPTGLLPLTTGIDANAWLIHISLAVPRNQGDWLTIQAPRPRSRLQAEPVAEASILAAVRGPQARPNPATGTPASTPNPVERHPRDAPRERQR
jgi:hypothetical protein